MRIRDYDTMYDENMGSTAEHVATGTRMQDKVMQQSHVYEEGFAASSGIRNETAETGGRVKHPEVKDHSNRNIAANSIEEENAGLADN
jgi:hypothetical protein